MKYLLEIHHGIGDVVQFTGIIDTIISRDNEANIAIIVNKEIYTELFNNDSRVQQFYIIDMNNLKVTLKNVIAMRKAHFDYFILSPISNNRASKVLAFLINAEKSFGEQLSNSRWLGFNKINSEKNAHIVERNQKIINKILGNKVMMMPRLKCNSDILDNEIDKKIAICIGTSIPQKTWDLKKYLGLAYKLEMIGYKIVLLGGKKEELYYKETEKECNYINLLGKTTLYETASVCGKCELVIGGDTGVMHIAAAMGACTLTLFTCTDPKLHAPFSEKSYYYSVKLPCQYCYEDNNEDKCKEYRCVNEINVDEVFEIVKKILNREDDDKYRYKYERDNYENE